MLEYSAFLENLAANKKLLFAAVALAALAVFFAVFWGAIGFVLLGFAYALAAIAGVIAVVLVWAKLHYRKPSLKMLFAEKKTLLAAIGIAEKRYLRHKLSESDFNSIFKEKQYRLIEVEALIDELYSGEKNEKIDEKIQAVQAKKRHVLKQLLDEKRRLVMEIDLAEKSYLKRKIDAATYGALVEKNQHALVDLEANIKELYNEANVSKVMLNLKERLSELEGMEKAGKKEKVKRESEKMQKNAESEREKILDIAGDIANQVSKK